MKFGEVTLTYLVFEGGTDCASSTSQPRGQDRGPREGKIPPNAPSARHRPADDEHVDHPSRCLSSQRHSEFDALLRCVTKTRIL